jgi:malonyl-CoA/methylmalonyl-CoA synthetase
MKEGLFAAIRAAMPADRSRPFAKLPDGRNYTYQDVLDVSGRFANTLAACGVRPGDRVAVQADKSIECLMLYLAAMRAGAVYLPLNTAYTGGEVRYFMADAEPVLFVCAPERHEEIAAIAAEVGVPRVDTLGSQGDGSLAELALGSSPHFEDVPRAGGDLAAILYTSGTTGRSKGAMLTQDNLLSNAEVLREVWRFTAEDVLLHALPIYHTHGLFVATNVVLLAGASMIFLPRFNVDEVIANLPQATAMMGVPTFYVRLLDDGRLTRELTANMRLFISGSAPLLAETHRGFEERTGHAILERYGMTETGMNTSNPYDEERRAGTVGFPLPEVDIRIADPESGRALPQGEVGVIEIRGPNVFKGYWRMPDKTAAEFRRDSFFISGDLGLIDERGYIHIVGRAKDLIISGGFNVYPKEVESAIDDLPGVRESAVIGVPHPDFGEGVVAAVVREDGAKLSEDDIAAALKDRLARFKQPKRVFFVDELPRNSMGKVQKNLLRDSYAKTFQSAA